MAETLQHQIIEEALHLIAEEEHWTRCSMARNKGGDPFVTPPPRRRTTSTRCTTPFECIFEIRGTGSLQRRCRDISFTFT